MKKPFYLMACAAVLMGAPALAQSPVAAPAAASPATQAAAPAPGLQAESTFFRYANNDAEYSVMLPEAPRVATIWADSGQPIPYLDNPPKEGSLGELATFRRVDQDTEDSFDVKITFLKAPAAYLSGLTEDKVKSMLQADYAGQKLENQDWYYSAGKNGLVWATVSGFSIDQGSHPFYNAEHFLTGKSSILVVRVKYSVENPVFADDYKKMTDNITYLAQ